MKEIYSREQKRLALTINFFMETSFVLRRLIVNKSNPPVRTDAAKSTAFVNETDYFGGALFHGKTFEIFPAGALGPFRIEHSGRMIRQIAAFDPIGENGAARRWQTAAVVQPAS